jgi:plastocyanin
MRLIDPRRLLAVLPLLALLWGPAALAEDPAFQLTIRDHKFEPRSITIPANTRIRLIVENADATPEEFESKKLDREKVIAGKSKATILIGPLEAGLYPFVGEFHQATASGVIIVE